MGGGCGQIMLIYLMFWSLSVFKRLTPDLQPLTPRPGPWGYSRGARGQTDVARGQVGGPTSWGVTNYVDYVGLSDGGSLLWCDSHRSLTG